MDEKDSRMKQGTRRIQATFPGQDEYGKSIGRVFVSRNICGRGRGSVNSCRIQRKSKREDKCEEEESVSVLGTVKVCFLRHHLDEDCSLNGQTSPL